MVTCSTARVATDRPGRYAKQLASHMARKVDAQWDSEQGRGHIQFTADSPAGVAGEVEMIAGEEVLLIQIEAEESAVDQLEKVIGSHLARFASQEDMVIKFKRPGGVSGSVWHSQEQSR